MASEKDLPGVEDRVEKFPSTGGGRSESRFSQEVERKKARGVAACFSPLIRRELLAGRRSRRTLPRPGGRRERGLPLGTRKPHLYSVDGALESGARSKIAPDEVL